MRRRFWTSPGVGTANDVALMVFPELCISGYAIDDLLGQDTLLDAVLIAIGSASDDLSPVLLVGAPLRHEGWLSWHGLVPCYRYHAEQRLQRTTHIDLIRTATYPAVLLLIHLRLCRKSKRRQEETVPAPNRYPKASFFGRGCNRAP
ncbi:hypothetical protein FHX15_005368 [Rhizobium sp. BK650]|nr:hypothetical protein [Rhizobium sp. BK650]